MTLDLKLPMPDTFRRMFREWSEAQEYNSMNLVKCIIGLYHVVLRTVVEY
jgi:hypothetical protein